MYSKYLLPILLLSGCKHFSNDSPSIYTNSPTLIQQNLKKSGMPIEVIESNIQFLSNSVRADNSTKLMYEVNLLNNYKVPLELTKVEVYDTSNDQTPIETFDSKYIEKNFSRSGSSSENVNLITGNQHGTLKVTLNLKNNEGLFLKVFHKFYFDRKARDGSVITHPVILARMDVPKPTTLTLGLPFNKKGYWLYETDAHRESRLLSEGGASYAQRFAIDWLLLDEQGRFANDDVKDNNNWFGYGVEMLAVANGVVVDVKDGIIPNEPLSDGMAVRINRETIGGNYVVIDIGNDIVAFYGHLIADSLKVKIGERVKKGQVIGLMGNSGSSSAPHLHFHLETKSDITMAGEGVPYHFENVDRLNTYSAEEVSKFFSENKVDVSNNILVKIQDEFLIGYGIIEL